jgi:hypothetical protein
MARPKLPESLKVIRVSTTISHEYLEKAKLNNVKLSVALVRGIRNIIEGDNLGEKVDILEQKNTRLAQKLIELTQRMWEFEEKGTEIKRKC